MYSVNLILFFRVYANEVSQIFLIIFSFFDVQNRLILNAIALSYSFVRFIFPLMLLLTLILLLTV